MRRSNWLLADLGEDPYGRHMIYSEHLLFPTQEAAKAIAGSNTSSKKEEETLKAGPYCLVRSVLICSICITV